MTIGCPIRPLLTRRPRIKMNQIHSNLPPVKSKNLRILSHSISLFPLLQASWHVISCFYAGWTEQKPSRVTWGYSKHLPAALAFNKCSFSGKRVSSPGTCKQNVWVPPLGFLDNPHTCIGQWHVCLGRYGCSLNLEQTLEHCKWRNVWRLFSCFVFVIWAYLGKLWLRWACGEAKDVQLPAGVRQQSVNYLGIGGGTLDTHQNIKNIHRRALKAS